MKKYRNKDPVRNLVNLKLIFKNLSWVEEKQLSYNLINYKQKTSVFQQLSNSILHIITSINQMLSYKKIMFKIFKFI